MKLIIESFFLFNKMMRINYKEMMKEINAKDVSDYIDVLDNLFIHEIEFNKELKFSEIIKIKEILKKEEHIKCVTLEDDNEEEIILFNKGWIF